MFKSLAIVLSVVACSSLLVSNSAVDGFSMQMMSDQPRGPPPGAGSGGPQRGPGGPQRGPGGPQRGPGGPQRGSSGPHRSQFGPQRGSGGPGQGPQRGGPGGSNYGGQRPAPPNPDAPTDGSAAASYAQCGRCQTSYALTQEELGGSRGRRLECSVCGHSWFQSRDRLLNLSGGFEMVPLPEMDKKRIALNMEQGRSPKFMGEIKLYVGNISFGSNEKDLFETFSECGEVGDVALVRDEQGRNRGFGFVTMRTKADGAKAMEELDGKDMNGRNIAVRESNS